VSDGPVNWYFGVSFNSDIRQPNGVASTNQYAIFGWADTRLANDNTQTQDNFSTLAQFSALPSTKNTTAPKIAAVFAGLIVAGVVLLVILQIRRRREGPPSAPAQRREPVGAR
jgi:sensor c-di-GMP phosphodiesterase-like protein